VYGPPPAKWSGACVAGQGFTAAMCNNKLIGAKFYNAGFLAFGRPLWPTDYVGPRDEGGHGTHTSSTAGGNEGVDAVINGIPAGSMSGMAPRARLAMYRVCWSYVDATTNGYKNSCFTSDSVKAIDDAVADGVDVINFSISGSQTNYLDPVEVAFFNAAAAGVFVAASAGNAGPANTVAHMSPWLTTVAASTHDRFTVANVTLIPFFSKGSTYWAIKNGLVPGAAFPPTFAVSNTCAPMSVIPTSIGDSVLVPFPFGIPLIAAAQAGAQDTLKCTETQTVQPAELRKLVATVNTYNAFIQAQAAARGFAYLDPNTLFTALPAGAIPAFPTITGAGAVSAPFGSYFSRDGVHPTALTHKLVANALITLINGTYATKLGAIP